MFGKYELLERINTGGMAETIKARDTGAPGRPIVAVKRVLPHLVEDEQYLTMFRDEARLLARLDHDNVIRTLEVGEVEGCPYAAIEYVHGQDARMLLHHARRGDTRIPTRIACYLVLQAARGLHYAHDLTGEDGSPLGLVHRDVSLQNILMSYEGHVKLIDFGIAMAAGNVDQTETGIIKGKFGYMSPEQVRNESLDRRSDVFALGICLWELLVGERLFPGKNSTETLRRVREADVESPRERNPEIPEALAAIVMRALARDPNDRHQTADEMRRALLAFMDEGKHECGPVDLAKYVREVFAEELRKQPSPDVLVSDVARRFDEDSGLAAFDGLDPVSAVSALHDQATDLDAGAEALSDAPPRAEAAPAVAPAAAFDPPPVEPEPATVPDMPVPAAPRYPSVPPIVPRKASIPEGHLTWDDVVGGRATSPRGRPPSQAQSSAARLRRVTPMPVRADPASGPRPVRRTPEPGALPRRAPMPAPVPPELHTAAGTPAPVRRGPSPAALVALGVSVAALVAAGMVLFGRPSPATLQLATAPVQTVVTIDGARLASDRSPFLITDLAPKVEHEIQVTKLGYRDWSAKLVLQPGQTLTLPLVTLEPTSAREPPTPVAAKPPLHPAPVPEASNTPGTTVGAVDATRARAKERTASAMPALERTEPVAARGATASKGGTGVLRINARPWGEVHVDGKYVGNTPQTALTLSAGSHVIRLTNPQFGLSKTIRVEIAPGDTVTKVVQLE